MAQGISPQVVHRLRTGVVEYHRAEVSVFTAPDHLYLVSFDRTFRIERARTDPPKSAPKKKAQEAELEESIDRLARLQGHLYRADRAAVLVIFQAMDAAG